ncbi:hypothetical protein ACS0TY_029136 [Phlomoides rotata]
MNPLQVSLAFTVLCFIITFNVCSSDPTHFTDDTLSVNCGSSVTSSAYSGKKWLGDVESRASPLWKLTGSSTTSAGSSKPTSADQVPHKTARVSRSQFSYEFQLNPGQKIIRLHFNPSAYRGFKGLKDLFTVEAGTFTLLGNFSASLTANALRVNSLTREFCLNIQENQLLHITFSAETSQSKDVYAFINGIEIISVPASLSYIQGGDIGLQVVGQSSLVNVDNVGQIWRLIKLGVLDNGDNSIALEIIHRLNTKQDLISSVIFGMTVTQKEVGNSNNVSWNISVDVGFRYLVRLHFSKLGHKMAETGALQFKVFINEMIADTNSDIVVKEWNGRSIPWYGDYILMMNGHKREGKRNLVICLQSDEEFMDGPLKGFEILKLSNHFNSLASPIPMPPSHDSTSQTFQIFIKVLGNRNAIGTVVMTILSIGGFGKVYKGLIDNNKNTVAVKRLKSNSNQGACEFLTEIETLSELRHINLVSLIGYCSEGREMILVYEYMACGTLADHLYNFARRGINASSLTWKQRLVICIGAGRGLDYLHTGHRVIHRDVKASNILLDDNFVAKVSDFGLAKPEDRSKLQSHVTTKVKGTFGYLDPYYFTTRKLTRKSDTYAFGVVLLEALCGRPAVDSVFSEDERILTIWARDKISKGEANQIVDSCLRDEISPNSLEVFVRVAIKCLEDEPNNRPTMSQVVLQLELALEQPESRVSSNHTDEINVSNESFTDVQAVTFPPTKHINSSYFSGKKDGIRKQKTYSPSRFTAWGAFWNRINPIKSIIENRAAGIKLPSDLCRHFSLDDIKTATRRFSDSLIIGDVRFGKAYVGVIDGATTVAIKRLGSSLYRGADEFVREIMVMSKLRYLHLQRLQICLGVAKGLHYLHTGVEQTIIHRDVKSSNILLNDKWEAKVCEFGQSKVCRPGGDDTHVTTMVQGTFGYLDPEYLQSCKLTDKSDVYSFGVTMFEVLCGRPPIDLGLPKEQSNLAAWVNFCYEEGTLENIIDCNVKGQIGADCLSEFAGTAIACLRLKGVERPSMRDVVLSLESAIKFHESAEKELLSS